jgi:tRNA (uracil-5-)-methyltransferase
LKIAQEKLENFEFKGNSLFTKIFKEEEREKEPAEKEFIDDGKCPEERINDQVTPLWRIPYKEQLLQKQETVKAKLIRLKKELFKFFPKKDYNAIFKEDDGETDWERLKRMTPEQRALEQLYWLKQTPQHFNGLPCELQEIIPSPIENGYRNKCEFSFGRDLNGEKSCGFLLGLYKQGFTAVLNPKDALNVPEKQKIIVNGLEDYVRSSELDTFDRKSKQGFFRIALVRTLASGETMLMLQVKAKGLSNDQIELEKKSFKIFIEEFAIKNNFTINSLYWQQNDDDFNGIKEDMKMELIGGNQFVTEHLLGLKFQISPASFFQVNPSATEVLYGKIRDLSINAAAKAKNELSTISEPLKNVKVEATLVGPDTDSKIPGVVLLDLCCGTGTIGITMAQYVKKVIGVELCSEAVEDAKKNAAANQIKNCIFLNGKVEEKMHGIFKYHINPFDKVIAILDPPRSGVHYSVIKSIRECRELKHVIFVACDLSQSLSNIIE